MSYEELFSEFIGMFDQPRSEMQLSFIRSHYASTTDLIQGIYLTRQEEFFNEERFFEKGAVVRTVRKLRNRELSDYALFVGALSEQDDAQLRQEIDKNWERYSPREVYRYSGVPLTGPAIVFERTINSL
ncbi:MAG: hypothetical protein WBA28_08740, partial [Microbacteriaceae bacterium]